MITHSKKYLLFTLLLASLADLIIPIFLGFAYPGYNHFIHTISTLGTGESPVQISESINLVVIGILFIIFSWREHLLFHQKSRSRYWYSMGIFLFGAGSVLAGIFPEDSKGMPETINGKIHGIASAVGFLFLIFTPLLAVRIKEFSTSKQVNISLFALALITFVLFLMSEDKTSGFLKYTGLFQRLNLIVLYGALIINFSNLNTKSPGS